MKTPFELLSEEHKNILKFVDVLLKECNASALNKDFFKKAIDFIRNYADKFHHAKEEDILFRELCKDAVKMQCNPVQQMLYEHDLGRKFVKGMEKGIKIDDKNKVVENAQGYAQLIQEHIFKEDNILYPMADAVLNERIKKSMLEKFKNIENKNKDIKRYLDILKNF